MSFLSPAALVFAAALPVVVIFYLLKRKRVVKLVSSTLLWQKYLADSQANAPFQRLRHNWLLLLQLLLLALIVFALMRPFFAGKQQATQLQVVILDASASMQATDEKPSRFEKARADALQLVDALRDGERMMVLLAGANTEVKQSPTTDKAALRRALQSCTPSDSLTRLADALKTGGAFTFEKKGEEEITAGEIHLFSDGAANDFDQVGNKNLPLVYHRLGQGGNNLGILSLDVRANPEDPRQRALFTSVGNFSTNTLAAELELRFDDKLIDTRQLQLAPTNTSPQVFLAPQSKDGVFTVRLNTKDDLAADNQASIVSRLPLPVKILLVTRGNQLLEKALKCAPNVELKTSPVLTDTGAAVDLVVLDDVLPTVWPAVNTLAIHVANTNWFDGWEVAKAPPIVDLKQSHPILRFVGLDNNVTINESLAVKTPSWGVALVESPRTALVIAGERERQRILWIGFDLLESNWPLRFSFPIFMVNAVEWLNPANTSAAQLLVHPGDSFRYGLPPHATSAEVTKPDGTTKPLPIDPGAKELIFGETGQQGIYQLKAGTNQTTFCVNLMDAAESDITPRAELPIGKYGKVSATTLRRASTELWRWIAAAGLAVLLFEWWFYHRRSA